MNTAKLVKKKSSSDSSRAVDQSACRVNLTPGHEMQAVPSEIVPDGWYCPPAQEHMLHVLQHWYVQPFPQLQVLQLHETPQHW